MPHVEEGSYFLYGRGFEPDQLGLGHLVLESYENPTRKKFHSFPPLRDAELQDVAYVREWNGKVTMTNKSNLGLDLLILGGGEIGPQFSTESKTIVSAEKARRIELKKPPEFFERVLANRDAKSKLQLWTSVSRSQYLMMRTGLRRPPKIWMLTGLLELTDGKSHVVKTKDMGLKVGIDPALVTALCGAPVGASIDLGRGVSVEVESQLKGNMVWAAQYQLLQTTFKNWDGKVPMAENEFRLHPEDIFAGGVVLGDSDMEQIAEIRLEPSDGDRGNSAEIDDNYWMAFEEAEGRVMDDNYWAAFEEAERRMLEDLAAFEDE